MEQRVYACIDLKSFYASVECVERGLDPLTTHLLVADASRTQKTICLAVSPALKACGVPGRPRLFEAVEKVKLENARRKQRVREFTGSSSNAIELAEHPEYELSFLIAPPRMAYYMKYSTEIFQIYLRYVAPEDIHVYSIDEVFLDLTPYLRTAGKTAHEFCMEMIRAVLRETGITATCGIGTNLYLAKVAMDIVAKHIPADRDGVRIAELDELSYRKTLWDHRPLTDFWRVGPGYAKKLEAKGLHTMGDIARCSIGKPYEHYNEELLYKLFGIHAELLIDHAWGWEPATLAEIKAYRPSSNSLSSGQVLQSAYTWEKARLIVQEMTDLLALDLVDQGLVTDQMVLTVGYDIENLTDLERKKAYHGAVTVDGYGRKIPKHSHGTIHLSGYSSSSKEMIQAISELFDRVADPSLLVRRVNVTADHVIPEAQAPVIQEQLNLFAPPQPGRKIALEKERRMQKALLQIQKRYGKNAILKGMNFKEGAMTRERNAQIGGHKA